MTTETTKTTRETVTAEQLGKLRDEACRNGDYKQAALCEQAMAYLASYYEDGIGRAALAKCVEAINAAEAMQ